MLRSVQGEEGLDSMHVDGIGKDCGVGTSRHGCAQSEPRSCDRQLCASPISNRTPTDYEVVFSTSRPERSTRSRVSEDWHGAVFE